MIAVIMGEAARVRATVGNIVEQALPLKSTQPSHRTRAGPLLSAQLKVSDLCFQTCWTRQVNGRYGKARRGEERIYSDARSCGACDGNGGMHVVYSTN